MVERATITSLDRPRQSIIKKPEDIASEILKITGHEMSPLRRKMLDALAAATEDRPILSTDFARSVYPDLPQHRAGNRLRCLLLFLTKDLNRIGITLAATIPSVGVRSRLSYHLEESKSPEEFHTLEDITAAIPPFNVNPYSMHAISERIRRIAVNNPDIIQGRVRVIITGKKKLGFLYTKEQFEEILSAISAKRVLEKPTLRGSRKKFEKNPRLALERIAQLAWELSERRRGIRSMD